MMFVRSGLVIALAACQSAPPEAPIDAAPGDAFDPLPPNEVSIDVTNEKLIYFRYRTADGPWLTPLQVGSEYFFRVYDEFEIISVCGDDTRGYHVAVEARTYEDRFLLLLCRTPSAPREYVRVTGTMAQAGRVAMVDTDVGATANWQFDLAVPRGTWDLVATAGDDVMIRRGVEISSPTIIADVDVTAGGARLLDLPLTTLDAVEADEVVSTRSWWGTTKGVQMFLEGPGMTARMVPDSLLASGEIRILALDAVAPPRFRSNTIRWDPPVSTTEIKLLARMDATFTDRGVAWSSLPRGQQAVLTLDSGRNTLNFHATPEWLRTRTEIALDLDIPDFRPEWRLGPLDQRRFEVITATFDHETSNSVTMRSGIREELAPASVARRRREDAERFIGEQVVVPTAPSRPGERAL